MRDEFVRKRSSLSPLPSALLALLLTACATAPSSSRLHLEPCTVAGAKARCGTFDVRESALSRRTLSLKVIVLPATMHNESPVFVFNGGPGQPTTAGADIEVTIFERERRLHDVVLVDQRGTGESAPLACPSAMKRHGRELVEGDLFPDAFITDCRKEIEEHANPAHYTIPYFLEDVERLRSALGYKRINIVALSYGTRSALMFLERYSTSVRSILLIGPLPPESVTPVSFVRHGQAALDRLIADAKATFPNFARDINSIGPWPVTIDSGGYHITMTRGAFAEFIRSSMMNVAGQSRVPLMIHRAAEGDWLSIAPLFIRYRKGWYDDIGPFLSITCPTDVRWIDADEIPAATAGTFFGDYRVRRQVAACNLWTGGRAARPSASTSSVPILITTGEVDPVTPPHAAESVARALGHARTIVFANSGHVEANRCAIDLEVAFFDAGSFEHLDDSCAKALKRPPFATKLP